MPRNVTLAIPDDLAREMDHFPQIRWSEVARRAFKQELARLQLYDQLFADSRLTEEDALELGRKVNRAVAKRYEEELQAHRGREERRPRKPKRRGSS